MTAEKHDKNMRPDEGAAEGLKWLAPKEPPFRLAGFAWFEQDGVYRRLPVNPKWPLRPPVDSLADCTAGGQIQFRTDSGRLSVRVRLKGPAGMNHMPQTGQCGFDCYIGPQKRQRFFSVAKYQHLATEYEVTLFDLDVSEMRNVTLNFPLYQGVEEVLVGVAPEAEVLAPPPYEDDRRIVVYGTSITQGGCAARPGMAYTNILSRKLNRPFINVGFSGNGQGDPEVARILAEIANPGMYVLDYEANATANRRLESTLHDFVRILREANADTPILVLSRTRFARDAVQKESVQGRIERRDFQKRTVEEFRAAGDENVFFLDGGDLLGDDFDEVTVDGVHLTDLGFWLVAKGLAPALEEILAK